MSRHMLKLENIRKSYQDGAERNLILDDISFHVEAGEFAAIVGPSGSGKSTLLSISGMMLSPDSGCVYLDGNNMSGLKQSEWTKIRMEHIGFIFQNHQLLPYLKGREQLTAFQNKEKQGRISAAELLEELGLNDCANRYPAQMSGGEKQRTAIARAFINDPDIILADEPTASLDRERGRQVVEMIRRETKKYQKAAVMVTHDERVLDLVDVVYHLDDSKLSR